MQAEEGKKSFTCRPSFTYWSIVLLWWWWWWWVMMPSEQQQLLKVLLTADLWQQMSQEVQMCKVEIKHRKLDTPLDEE